ncbi:MAG: glycogen/starch/alpha-glucan phosphorylase [Thermodesulfobacteriota bacterium]
MMEFDSALKISYDSGYLRNRILYHLKYSIGKKITEASNNDFFHSISLAVRELIIDRMLGTEELYNYKDTKKVYCLSLEYLIGRSLTNNLINLGLYELCREALAGLGVDLSDIVETESDPALGNGGLGRLAACFLDSLATLGIPGFGYGINYDYGLFKQDIVNGYQVEQLDHWLGEESPWLIERREDICVVPIYGQVKIEKDLNGNYRSTWRDWKFFYGVPYDMPIVGYGNRTVNYLRLYSARSSNEFDMKIFNSGDYVKAVEQKIKSETVSKVLYPSDTVEQGKELRVIQEYFLVSCAIRDIVRQFLRRHEGFGNFASKVAIQLNDTHPALAIVELMRMLVDENDIPWERAWAMTEAVFGFTNHTLLPEAMEQWPTLLFGRVIPRHLEIIYDINERFLKKVTSRWPGDINRLSRMSLVEEGNGKMVRMAQLSIVGSHSVNGVAALHSELIRTTLVPDFYELWPDKFNNKTNGITQRRWLLTCNPGLANLINRTIGDGWITDLYKLRPLENYAGDETFQQQFQMAKRVNKANLAKLIHKLTRITVNPESMFDVQIKRIHEYKRQLLNIMHIVHQYFSITEDGAELNTPRTYIFAGKAAPGYWAAKQIIKLINNVAHVINNDPRANKQIKVIFIPDYKVTLAEIIIPAADLSEQISTAGKEASGTGNMKLALNGALTIGTMDGANIEIREEVGEENIFIFGLRAEEIMEMKRTHSYNTRKIYEENPDLKRVMDSFESDMFCKEEHGIFKWVYEALLMNGDVYFHIADFESYVRTQQIVGQEFKRTEDWLRKAILNVARIGKFSSDRTISEYAEDIWKVNPVKD